jgi:serine/threonine protein kinase
MADRVGQQFGNYRLDRLLGRGGFAEVYLGAHIHLNRFAAIKILYNLLADKDIENFRKEARTIAHLEHPHIVRILEFDMEEGIPFLVMNYAPNGTLRKRYPKGTRLPLDTIVSYVNQVAEALQYAHDEKIIHRDIKPENMLLGGKDEVLLSDFGIATIIQNWRSQQQSIQTPAGTPFYMAPEQFKGKPRRASDQYALGIVVYEWLSGDRPFNGSFFELSGQHLHVPPPPLLRKVPTVPPSVEQVVMKALAKDPNERFESIVDFAEALEEASKPPVVTIPSTHQLLSSSTPTPQVASLPSALEVNSLKHVSSLSAAIPPTDIPQSSKLSVLSHNLEGFLQRNFSIHEFVKIYRFIAGKANETIFPFILFIGFIGADIIGLPLGFYGWLHSWFIVWIIAVCSLVLCIMGILTKSNLIAVILTITIGILWILVGYYNNTDPITGFVVSVIAFLISSPIHYYFFREHK